MTIGNLFYDVALKYGQWFNIKNITEDVVM